MGECNYQSFNALAKIHDPELLHQAFGDHIAPQHSDFVNIQIFEFSRDLWQRVNQRGYNEPLDDCAIESLLKTIPDQESHEHYHNNSQAFWLYGYKPYNNKRYALKLECSEPEILMDSDYIQLLFQFYCNQLHLLKGTFRDALTGLYNRRAFNRKFLQLLNQPSHNQRRNRFNQACVFVMFDIDHFKKINDNYGHLYGDEVLLLLAQMMSDSFRENDLLFRYGGEEFAALLMDIESEQAESILNRFREKIEGHDFPGINQVTISIGLSLFDPKLAMDEIIGQADKALYYAKENGRNAVFQYQTLLNQGSISALEHQKTNDYQIF